MNMLKNAGSHQLMTSLSLSLSFLLTGLNFSLLGNLEARDCPGGFIAKGRTLCVDIDECKEWDSNPPCGSNAACYNTQGSFYCLCLPGFISTTTFQFTALTGECKGEDYSVCVCTWMLHVKGTNHNLVLSVQDWECVDHVNDHQLCVGVRGVGG